MTVAAYIEVSYIEIELALKTIVEVQKTSEMEIEVIEPGVDMALEEVKAEAKVGVESRNESR